jgi:hypothetical protein
MLNPGQLTDGHQRIKEKCLSCHTPFQGIDNNKCISCHKLSEIGKNSLKPGSKSAPNEKILFHSSLANQECSSCHTDHKGVHPESSITSFNHEMLEIATRNNCLGCHRKPTDKLHIQLSVACNNCHNTKGWKSATAFDHNMIHATVRNNCKNCHEPPKDNYHQLIKENCDKCHSADKWVPSTFDHTTFFAWIVTIMPHVLPVIVTKTTALLPAMVVMNILKAISEESTTKKEFTISPIVHPATKVLMRMKSE